MASTQFKERYRNHKSDFNNAKKRNTTELSKLIWELKDENKNFSIEWVFLKKVKKINANVITCRLCLEEAKAIMESDETCINRKNEIMGTCRHRSANKLKNWKKKKRKAKKTRRANN